MPLHHFRSRWHPKSVAGLLVLCLLLAQWTGFNHRIMHGGGQGSTSQARAFAPAATAADADDVSTLAHHSCVAFDAAALAATIHSTPFSGPLLPNPHVLALWRAFASWHAPFSCHFLSRAPPAA